jgi:drug/metabolite transporter (DMT)-like permease
MNLNLKPIQAPSPAQNLPLRAYLIALLIIFAAAAGPITIKQTQLVGVPSLAIIAARLVIASLVLCPIVLQRYHRQLGQIQGRDWLFICAAGLVFALNLLLLFLALQYTTVLVTTVLRSTTPLWMIWLEVIFLEAVFTRSVWLGLGFTLGGSIMVGLGSGGVIATGSQPWWGATLALIGSVSLGLYLLLGRRFSQRLPSLLYSWLVFVAAMVITLIAVFVSGTPLTGYTWEGYGWIIVVTIVTQFLGHIPINQGLHYFPATYMSLILQLAIVVSAVLAFIFFYEVPSPLQIVGCGVIMAGVMLVNWKK